MDIPERFNENEYTYIWLEFAKKLVFNRIISLFLSDWARSPHVFAQAVSRARD